MHRIAIRTLPAFALAAAAAGHCADNDTRGAAEDAYASLASTPACELLTSDELAEVTGTEQEIQQASPCEGNRSCRYAWPKPNAEALREQIVKKIANGDFGEDPFADFHLLQPTYEVTLEITTIEVAANASAEADTATVPADTDTEETADPSAAETTEDETVPVGREEITGLGDAAWWSPTGGGRLTIEAGGHTVTLSVFADQAVDENLQIAKALAERVLTAAPAAD